MLSHISSADEVAVVEAVMSGLRWVVVLLGAYLVVSTAASLVVHGLRPGRRAGLVVRAVDAVTLPPVRRLVRAAVGVSVAAGTFTGTAPAGASTDPPVPVMRRLGDDAPVMVQTTRAAEPVPPEPAPTPPSAPAVDPTLAPAAPAARAAPAIEWTVRPGDHFWRIAEEVLATQLHRAPADGETDPYWRRLVTANRDRLADRENADLLFPGQVLVLPASTGT